MKYQLRTLYQSTNYINTTRMGWIVVSYVLCINQLIILNTTRNEWIVVISFLLYFFMKLKELSIIKHKEKHKWKKQIREFYKENFQISLAIKTLTLKASRDILIILTKGAHRSKIGPETRIMNLICLEIRYGLILNRLFNLFIFFLQKQTKKHKKLNRSN